NRTQVLRVGPGRGRERLRRVGAVLEEDLEHLSVPRADREIGRIDVVIPRPRVRARIGASGEKTSRDVETPPLRHRVPPSPTGRRAALESRQPGWVARTRETCVLPERAA